jgi:hypothetical protein
LATLREQVGSSPTFVWSESIQDSTGRDVDLEGLRQEENLLGDFLRLAHQADGPQLEAIRAKLGPLFEDPRMRRYLRLPEDEKLLQWLEVVGQLGVDRLLPGDD